MARSAAHVSAAVARPRTKPVTPTRRSCVPRRASEHAETTRRARRALLEAASKGDRTSLRDVVQTVQEGTNLDPGMIQHALWILVHERALMLDDDLDVTRAVID